MEMLQEVLGSLGFNVHIALANFFNFLIIFFLLQKFFFKKIAQTINDRKVVIEEGVRKSEESEIVLHDAKEQAKGLVISAEKKGEEILKDTELKSKSLAHDIKNDALHIAETLKLEAEKIKTDSFEAGLLELSAQKEKIIAKMFEKALATHMTEDINNSYITGIAK